MGYPKIRAFAVEKMRVSLHQYEAIGDTPDSRYTCLRVAITVTVNACANGNSAEYPIILRRIGQAVKNGEKIQSMMSLYRDHPEYAAPLAALSILLEHFRIAEDPRGFQSSDHPSYSAGVWEHRLSFDVER